MLRLLLTLSLMLLATPAMAQTRDGFSPAEALTQAETDLRAVDKALDDRIDKDERIRLRASAVTAQQTARASASRLADDLELLDARIAGLGPVVANTIEAPDIQQQRVRLAKDRASIDAAVKRGRLVDIEAQQLIAEIDRGQAAQLNETLSARVSSPLAPGFWRAVVATLPRDLRRIDLFLSQGAAQVVEQRRGGIPWQALIGTLLALVVLIPVRLIGRRFGQRYLIGNTPGHRVRRSAYAIWTVLVGTLSPLLAAVLFEQGLRWSGLLAERWAPLLDSFVVAVGFSAFIVALAGAVLMRSQPSWRVAPISDETATQIRPLSWALAALAFTSMMVDAFNAAVGASSAALIATQAIEAVLYLALIAYLLRVLGQIRAARATHSDAESQTASAGLSAITLVAWLTIGVAFVALLIGYVGLAIFAARMVVWLVVLGSALYLLMHAADDVTTTLFQRDSRIGIALTRGVGLRGSLVDQFGLLLSAAFRIALVLLAISMLLSPFGAGGVTSLFGRLGTVAQGVQIGGLSISPGAILRSIIVLFVGLALVRWCMTWLENRYLPVTDLDGSSRSSVSLVARYVGVALALIWAIASLGIGMERIALLLSALSVGIGFGLQAITQNFVSGLILLAERPIKIGDWIRVGTDEGDVKRINVRSTEIALPDHSTLIVPNSELITKTVLNKTLSAPLGRIQVQFSVPLGTSPAEVRQIVLDVFAAEPAIVEDPAPSTYIDSIADGRIKFNCFAHVASPRDAYKTRSNVFFVLLTRLGERHIDIGSGPQRMELIPMPGTPDILATDAANTEEQKRPST